jgi:hypothetical protein
MIDKMPLENRDWKIEQVEKNDGQYPEFIAFVNSATNPKVAYQMKFRAIHRISVTKKLIVVSGEVAKFWTCAEVCDAYYLRSFKISLNDGLSSSYLDRLSKSHFSFKVDGERVLDKVPFGDILSSKEHKLPRRPLEKSDLFEATTLSNDYAKSNWDPKAEANYDDWVGFMLPNGSLIEILFEDLPFEHGVPSVSVEIDLALYTTKGYRKHEEQKNG